MTRALARRIAGELGELPLPYQLDVQPYPSIEHAPLRDHIDRVGRSFFVRECVSSNSALTRRA
jgi:hypothetical protein